MRKFLNYCFIVLFAAVALCACDDDDENGTDVPTQPETTLSSKCAMTQLSLQIAQAEELAAQDYYVTCSQDDKLFSTVNQKGVALNQVNIKFTISEKASVYVSDAAGAVSGAALKSGESAIDLSQGVAYLKVIAENGVNYNVYTVKVNSAE